MKIHKYLCFALWGLWGLGLCLTGISAFCFQHDNWLFWKLVVPYNILAQFVSLIPLEPIFCFWSIHDRKKAKQSYASDILLLCITALFWIAYITLYVSWTGGV